MISIGELIDKLSIVNIKIWDATTKAHEAYKNDKHTRANSLFKKVEAMNVQRRELIKEINIFFHENEDALNHKSFKNSIKRI